MPRSAPARPLRTALVMLAGGDGRRVGQDTNKVLLPLAGRRVFTWSIRWARELSHLTHTVLVIRDSDHDVVREVLRREVEGEVDVVTGGDSRHASEWAALQVLAEPIEAGEVDVVVIHDAARPLASTRLFTDVITAAGLHGGAIPVLEQHCLTTVDAADRGGRSAEATSVADGAVVSVQTPQAFLARPLLEAYSRAQGEGFVGTDTASCIERYTDLPVHCVPGDARNIKITFPEDLFVAERLLAKADYSLTERPREPSHRLAHLRQALRRGEPA